ncbi:MAG: hypothetical protein HY908_08545, partial [Myxococcales bacterium]|nr:hypothetical protein [Myxococcales bacterium]
ELERRARAEHATRGELESELGALEAQLTTRHERQRGLAGALAQARADFRAAAQRIGLGPDASLEEAEAVLDTLGVLGSELDKLRERRAQVAELERAGTELEREVRALCEAHAPDLVGAAAGPAEAERMAAGLLERSARARRELEDRTRLLGELAARRAELAEVAERRLSAVAALEQLCAAAGVADEVELERAEGRAAEARELDRALEETLRALGEIGDGTGVEALRAEAEGHASVAVAERLLELGEESAELEAELEQATDTAVRLRLGLERYEHEQGAVDLANEAEQRLAWVERTAARFVRVRLATLVLDREIERYRRANQGPVVARAAELLGALTTGSLVDLGVEYAADDTAHLVCLRPGGSPVAVEALSDGARDQLFLALRLATLERFVGRATEPLPLVLDDVLIHFDDERARAALGVLADFAAQTQVLFFTHHARLRDIARELAAEPRYRGRIFEALLPATPR